MRSSISANARARVAGSRYGHGRSLSSAFSSPCRVPRGGVCRSGWCPTTRRLLDGSAWRLVGHLLRRRLLLSGGGGCCVSAPRPHRSVAASAAAFARRCSTADWPARATRGWLVGAAASLPAHRREHQRAAPRGMRGAVTRSVRTSASRKECEKECHSCPSRFEVLSRGVPAGKSVRKSVRKSATTAPRGMRGDVTRSGTIRVAVTFTIDSCLMRRRDDEARRRGASSERVPHKRLRATAERRCACARACGSTLCLPPPPLFPPPSAAAASADGDGGWRSGDGARVSAGDGGRRTTTTAAVARDRRRLPRLGVLSLPRRGARRRGVQDALRCRALQGACV